MGLFAKLFIFMVFYWYIVAGIAVLSISARFVTNLDNRYIEIFGAGWWVFLIIAVVVALIRFTFQGPQ